MCFVSLDMCVELLLFYISDNFDCIILMNMFKHNFN
jgi:hypothetical protein